MKNIPLFIARPSGVWNLRSPLHNFVVESNKITVDFSVSTMAIHHTRYLMAHRSPSDKKTSVRSFLQVEASGPVAMKAWTRYRDACRRLSGNHTEQPSFDEFDEDLAVSLYSIREYSVARFSSLFETYVQCWALNMLLAHIESGQQLDRELQKLASDFSPFRQRYIIPTVPSIFEAFETINDALDNLPHITTDPMTRSVVSEPIAAGVNAKSVILFWRDFRNSIVHHDGLITHTFCNKHSSLFETLRQPFADVMKPLEPGARLQLPDQVFSAMATTHVKTAIWLNEQLKKISTKRGETPNGEPTAEFKLSIAYRPLLVEGDHADSLRWLNDSAWRNEMLTESPRKWHTLPK